MSEHRNDFHRRSLLRRTLSRRSAILAGGGTGVSLVGATILGHEAGAQDATPGAVPTDDGLDELTIGGLLSLTGGWSTLGIASEAALAIAADDINAEMEATGSPVRVGVTIEDTQLVPEIAQDKAQSLVDQGAQVLIGPQSSAEVAALKPFVDTQDVLLVSHGSTASSLSFRNDNIFRVIPTGVAEVEAMIALMEHDGIEVVAPIWLDDVGNGGLHDSLTEQFPAQGRTLLDGIEYAPGTEDFSEIVATLGDQVEQALSQHDATSVAVFLATFDDVTPIFEAAREAPSLSSVRWYGTDGAALIDSLTASNEAAAFAVEVEYAAALLGLDEETRQRWQPMADRIEAVTGEAPGAASLAAYDAAWLATLAYLETGGSGSIIEFRNAFARSADRYYGVTGPMTLTAAGDRSTGHFDFWGVRQTSDGYTWVRVAHYSGATGDVTVEADAGGGATPQATPAS